jgi:hypothetical protein
MGRGRGQRERCLRKHVFTFTSDTQGAYLFSLSSLVSSVQNERRQP